MDNTYTQAVEDQAKKSAREVRRVGEEVRKQLDDAVSRGKEVAEELGSEAQAVADRAREYMDTARRKAGKAARQVTNYADDNTALVTAAAFGVGLLVGYLVARKSSAPCCPSHE